MSNATWGQHIEMKKLELKGKAQGVGMSTGKETHQNCGRGDSRFAATPALAHIRTLGLLAHLSSQHTQYIM